MNVDSILITGDSHGIGAAASFLFLERGITVFGCSSTHNESPKVKMMKEKFPSSYHHFVCDVSDEEQIKSMLSAISVSGALPGCIFVNAGIGCRPAPITETNLCDAKQILNINLLGAFLTVRQCLLTFGTDITFIISGSIASSEAGTGADWSYSASKAGLRMLINEARLQFPRSVFYHLEMGYVQTRMTCTEDQSKHHYAKPDEIAEIIFSLSNKSFVPVSDDIKILGGKITYDTHN